VATLSSSETWKIGTVWFESVLQRRPGGLLVRNDRVQDQGAISIGFVEVSIWTQT